MQKFANSPIDHAVAFTATMLPRVNREANGKLLAAAFALAGGSQR